MFQRTLPSVPVEHLGFLKYLADNEDKPITTLLEPYDVFDGVLRELFAQEPSHTALKNNLANLVPLFDKDSSGLRIRARPIDQETTEQKNKYIMPLKPEDRRANGSPATVPALEEFKNNFSVFSEGSLADIDWSNVVASGSAVTTCLLPVPSKHSGSKRALRTYYHEMIAPASDVDLFLYGLTEEAAAEKIQHIEGRVRDTILAETITVRTKNAITIASQYPNRHIQVVLRCYKSISEILTGFDVDCSRVAYDGRQIYATPRALAAFATQCNTIDLSRRSPSYENRLAKYARRGFEVFWPSLEREKIDPTIFERSFNRTLGLARLLVLEKLPKSTDRDNYSDERRQERGRPPITHSLRQRRNVPGDLKADALESAEWLDEDEVSNYHTFTVPYGLKFHARKIEKLLYTKDILLNAEWNRPKDRVRLHRHPAFLGASAAEALADCCEHCPTPSNDEELAIAEQESKVFVHGRVQFLKDDPGRQAIGSFNPTTDDNWTEMAYVADIDQLCQAIVDEDTDTVRRFCAEQKVDLNQRDYCGRTPLHIATLSSSSIIVEILLDLGARITPRLADGRTALHLAAARGNIEVMKSILDKNEANEAKKFETEDAARLQKFEQSAEELPGLQSPTRSEERLDNSPDKNEDGSTTGDSMTEGSFVKVQKKKYSDLDEDAEVDIDTDKPDVLEINAASFDQKATSLHYAIINGHEKCAKILVSDYGADPLLPLKLSNAYDGQTRAVIIPLVLATRLPSDGMFANTRALLNVGATSAQMDNEQVTALQYFVAAAPQGLTTLFNDDGPAAKRAMDHFTIGQLHYGGGGCGTALTIAISSKDERAIRMLLKEGCEPFISLEAFRRSRDARAKRNDFYRPDDNNFRRSVEQPVILAIRKELPEVACELLDRGADANVINGSGYQLLERPTCGSRGLSLLDLVCEKLQALRRPSEDISDISQTLKADDYYLKGLEAGTYRMWRAQRDLQQAREKSAVTKAQIQEKEKTRNAKGGVEEKQAALGALIAGFEALKTKLVGLKAQTFKELHPDLPENADRSIHRLHAQPRPEKPYETSFRYWEASFSELDDSTAYATLFEAAWSGDCDIIKKMTLQQWGENGENAPLLVASTDAGGFSPFSIALLRGHDAIAKVVLEIARAQHAPPQEERRRYNVSLGGHHNNIAIESEVVDEELTPEVLAGMPLQAKSQKSALTLLNEACCIADYDARVYQCGEPLRPGSRFSLFQYAVYMNDLSLFQQLLDLEDNLILSDDKNRPISDHFLDYQCAIRLGRVSFIEVLMKRAGTGLALEEILENTGHEVNEHTGNYRGLNVRGKKRKDWARAPNDHPMVTGRMLPPLLEVARSVGPGVLDSCIFMTSDQPIKLYSQFAENNRGNKRVAALYETTDGLAPTLEHFLNDNNSLAIHCAIIAESTNGGQIVEYLLSSIPTSLDFQNSHGRTPLEIAFRYRRVDAAKVLIARGADQTCRNSEGDNLLHVLFKTSPDHSASSTSLQESLQQFRAMLTLLDTRLLASMLSERSLTDPGSVTPIARFLDSGKPFYLGHFVPGVEQHLEALDDILSLSREHSQNSNLELVNGAGDTPLHSAVKSQLYEHVRRIAAHSPSLLLRENAAGQTPLEAAKEAYISECLSAPPSLIPQDPPGIRHALRRFGRRQSDSLADMDPEEFLIRQNATAWDRMSGVERTWRVCQEIAEREENKGIKRKLVSLWEANEVAKRLARRAEGKRTDRGHLRVIRHTTRRRRSSNGRDDDEGLDEVEKMLRVKGYAC